jgi:hypothetical protein
MEQQIRTTESDTTRSRRAWFTTVRLGIAMTALGFVAALTLVFVSGGTGPSDTLAIADLSAADRAVDSATGPAATLVNDVAGADRYVSANPFLSVPAHTGGGSANASVGIGRLTSDHRNQPPSSECSAIVIDLPGYGVYIDTGWEVCNYSAVQANGQTIYLRIIRIG